MFDEDELKKQDEVVLYEKYKELRKKYEKARNEPFKSEGERQRYEDERREDESLRRRFLHDTERKKADAKKKQEAKRRKEKKEARERNKTELYDKIEGVERDFRRLERDRRVLQEDMEDFQKLKTQIERRDGHDSSRVRRMPTRDLLERKERKEEWDRMSTEGKSRTAAGDTVESLTRQLKAFQDVELEYESSYYDDEEANKTRAKDPDADLESEELKEETESSSTTDSSESPSEGGKEKKERRGNRAEKTESRGIEEES
jgi:hypothetical protein